MTNVISHMSLTLIDCMCFNATIGLFGGSPFLLVEEAGVPGENCQP